MANTQTAERATGDRSESASRSGGRQLEFRQDLVDYLREYAREKPEVAALWCFGIGFIIGWKLKPW